MLQGFNDVTLALSIGNSVNERSFSITEETEQFILNDASYKMMGIISFCTYVWGMTLGHCLVIFLYEFICFCGK